MHITQSTRQNTHQRLQLQERISLELDEGISDIYEITKQYPTNRTSPVFIREIVNYLIVANSKLPLQYQNLRKNKELLSRTVSFAAAQHQHQDRESGYPYTAHVFSTGYILARFGLPFEVTLSGILHDTKEESLKKDSVAHELASINPAVLFYVFAVSAKPIEIIGLEQKDIHLHNQIQEFSKKANNAYPQAIKCADNITNLFDLPAMGSKNGLSSKQRKEKFLKTTIDKIIPYAEHIDSTDYVKIYDNKHRFSLKAYIQEKVTEHINMYNLDV
jgi:(p)ppGpp synthase/HD superfamily hydrolase